MAYLNATLRRTFERTIQQARVTAETGAADALRRLGVADARRPAHLTEEQAQLRIRLRAHARALGDLRSPDGTQAIDRLIEQAAYVQWHRLLFARFLLERRLLRHPEDGGDLTLLDCREEAAALELADEWAAAAHYTARLLPGVFPPDDPAETVSLAPEHARALRQHLLSLDAAIFAADDSLGWTYQFWRAAEKNAVNESQVKIGAAELPAVTQLFTEPYMVRFLLHNTLGAWWSGKVLAARPEMAREAADEPALRTACALPGYQWEYLRFVREGEMWRPAAGSFPGWPAHAAEITLLDPCCGSGHFLTEALAALATLRGTEESLSPADAVTAVLHDNLYGLEIDGRCVQIAAFALALAAWRISGPQTKLPTPHVAWVGAPPPLPKSEFIALANGDAELQRGLGALHDLFRQAPLLGSLIEVAGGDLASPARIARVEEMIAALVEKMRGAEPERAEGALAARGMADAAAILARRFTLQVTNVPFLGRGRQEAALAAHLKARFDNAKADLAIAMLERMEGLAMPGGTVTAIIPQGALFLSHFLEYRKHLLETSTLRFIAALGPGAFTSISGEVVSVALVGFAASKPGTASLLAGIDLNDTTDPEAKAGGLCSGDLQNIEQESQRHNPNAIITAQPVRQGRRLSELCSSVEGLSTGDAERFIRRFWEIPSRKYEFEFFHGSPDKRALYDGMTSVLLWERGKGALAKFSSARVQGHSAWTKAGVLLGQMGQLPTSLYVGCIHEKNSAAVIPYDPTILPAVFAFLETDEYRNEVRKIDRAMKVTNGTLVKVPFDLVHWQKVAAERYPNGLPEPHSDDPTQWLFHGHPRHAEPGTELHVALARLAGYRWPAESDAEMRLSAEAHARIAEVATLLKADADGPMALVPVLGERPLAERLRTYCAAAWGEGWQPGTEAALVAAACEHAKDKPPKQLTLDAWLRTHAGRQHAKLFHDRPFLWWITDGRADGFTAVVHYHRLNRANLERLAYTTLGDWITRLGDDPRAEAARILQDKLARVFEGESPYDIFVRWKPLERQPLGWEPDLDDGVRLNIRPFVEAGVLAHVPNVKYGVDRGKDVASAPWYHFFNGERRNGHHTTLAEKQAAREAAVSQVA